MTSKFIASALIAAASLASVSAFAAGAGDSVEAPISLTSIYTRAEVQAQARTVQQGPVTASNLVDGGTAVAAAPVASERSRNEVRAEAAQANTHSLNNTAPGRA